MDDRAEVFDFLDQCLRDRAAGREQPLSHYLSRYPGHEEEIAREYLALRGERANEVASVEAHADRDRVGPYRLIRELGRGGQSSVWLADDTRIARKVALKLLPQSFAALSAERRARLKREAEIVAKLAHPALATIYEAQIDGDAPFIAMRWVEGRTLAAVIERASRGESPDALAPAPLEPIELAKLLAFFERAARALHAAHEAGVVHRDVKPANLMVDERGEPVVLDFGIARVQAAEPSALTLAGEVFGTPAYMSPEQISGAPNAVDRRSDVWALGACLFEALTLERPFRGSNVGELMQAIREAPLKIPRERGGPIGDELAVVLETALEKEPARRYASALDFAEDLRRLREYEPIHARPAGPLLRLRRWSQRHPALAVALSTLFVTLSGGLAWTLHLLSREARALADEQQALELAEQRLQFAVGRHLSERANDLVHEDPTLALALGIDAVGRAPNYQTRAALFTALEACRVERILDRHPARQMHDLRPSPDGRLALAALDHGVARVYELSSGATAFETPPHPGEVTRAAWLGSTGRFATISSDAKLRIFDLARRELVGEVELAARPLELSTDREGERIAIADAHGIVSVADRDGTILGAWAAIGRAWALSEDGGQVAIHSSSCPPAIDIACVRERAKAFGSIARIDPARSLEFSADGRSIVGIGVDRWIGSTRLDGDGVVLDDARIALAANVTCARPSPDGSRVAITYDAADGVPRAEIWEPSTGRRIELRGHGRAPVVDADFDPTGERLATASQDMTIRVWSVDDGRELAVGKSFRQPVSVRWTGDGARLLTRNLAHDAQVWFAGALPDIYELRGHGDALTSACFAPDGHSALTTSLDGTARVFATPRERDASPGRGAAAGRELARLAHDGPVRGGQFAKDGERVLTFSDDGSARLWRTDEGVELGRPIELGRAIAHAELSPDDRCALAVGVDGALVVARLDRASSMPRLADDARCARFSPDGRRVLAGHRDDRVSVWTIDGALERELRFDRASSTLAGVAQIAVRPDGGQIAVAGEDSRVRFFDPVGASPQRGPLQLFRVQHLAYSPDGTRIAATGALGRGAFHLHDLARNASVPQEVFHQDDINALAFDPSGRFCVTASGDATAYVRDATNGKPFAQLRGHRAAIVSARFSEDEGPLRAITASKDGVARVSPIDPLPSAKARAPRAPESWEIDRESRLALPLRYP